MAMPKGLVNRGLERVNVTFPVAADVIDTYVYIADKPMEVLGVQVIFAVKGSDGGGLSLDVKKCTGTTAVASGTSVLVSTFDIGTTGTAATLVSKTLGNGGLSATLSARMLAAGDKLSFDFTGTTTAIAGLFVMVTLRPTGAKSSIY